MKKFIRLDMNGHWRGAEHRSSMNGLAEEFEMWEDGVSCYDLADKAYALESLTRYWKDVASMSLDDFDGMQVTIFEGEKLDKDGFDGEDLAVCTATLNQFPARPLMKQLYEAFEALQYGIGDEDPIEQEEYEELLQNIEL